MKFGDTILKHNKNDSNNNYLKKIKNRHSLKKNLILSSFALPGLLFMIFFCYIPMLGTVMAFLDIRMFKKNFVETIFSAKWVGFKNFEFFINTPDAFIITRNTILYNLVFILAGLFFSVAVAIIINEMRGKFFPRLFQTTYFLPYFISWVVVSYIVYAMLNGDLGFFNKILKSFGVEPIMWYSEAKYWPGIFIFLNLWKYTGYNSVIYLSSIVGIDNTYYEAAAVDGASKWQQTTKITLPLLKPMIIMLTIIAVGRVFYSDWGMFWNVPLQSGQLTDVYNTIDVYVYRALTGISSSLSLSAAVGFYQSVIGFLLVLSVNYIVRKIDDADALF